MAEAHDVLIALREALKLRFKAAGISFSVQKELITLDEATDLDGLLPPFLHAADLASQEMQQQEDNTSPSAAAQAMKPLLARGRISVIGATTVEEYRQLIESDKALERRFQPLLVNQMTVEQTREVLAARRVNIECEKSGGVQIVDLQIAGDDLSATARE